MQTRIILMLAVTAVTTTACSKPADTTADTGMAAQGVITPPAHRAAEEAAIKEADAEFFTAVNARNAAAAAETYSDDAVYMEAGSPAITGKDAIRKHLENLVKLPQLAMSGEAIDIKFSDDGTVAYETGKYSLGYADAKGNPVKDEGKYLIVWRKFDGTWKTVAESNNSDKAPAQ
ncbi:MAG TPA: SgcJ/EcaC family oxidoreductase [Gemmatimonadaceae bacterium]|nr:SgcJ/EcaC family oxidoreductase [Gemmatimonadaceae bacterium]